MNVIPAYADLPELGTLGIRHARDVLPAHLGTLSFIGSTEVAAAGALVREGQTIGLNLPVDVFDPPLFGRDPVAHRVIETSRNEAEDLIDAFNPQASSQLDGLAHVRAREYGYFDGSTDLPRAREATGMHHWAARGIASRGVLIDATEVSVSPMNGYAIKPGELADLAREQGVELRRGDILLIRTGWVPRYLSGIEPQAHSWNGLEASEDMAAYLWNTGIAAVGADNPAVENAPGDPAIGSLHRRLLPALGMPLFELLELDALSSAMERRANRDFLFVSVPLNVRGGVSSPANAMALL